MEGRGREGRGPAGWRGREEGERAGRLGGEELGGEGSSWLERRGGGEGGRGSCPLPPPPCAMDGRKWWMGTYHLTAHEFIKILSYLLPPCSRSCAMYLVSCA